MKKRERNPLKKLEPLELLDLRRRATVSEIVDGMERCSFGARMLGEVTKTLAAWIEGAKKPLIIYDGFVDDQLGKLLTEMVELGWFSGIVLPEHYATWAIPAGGNVLVVGDFSRRYAPAIYGKPAWAIFINASELCRPGQVGDGYFPDVVFADPEWVLPIIWAALIERLEGTRQSVSDLFADLAPRGGTASRIAHGATTLRAMVEDPECSVALTLSGAMTVAQMGLVLCDMIDLGMAQYIASTGALMAHGLVQSVGLKHYKYDPAVNDTVLARWGGNRVTDTVEPESNLDHVAEILHHILEGISGAEHISPSMLHYLVGRHLKEHYPKDRGILKSAYEKGVPVVVPAFVDSELGNDVYVHNRLRMQQGTGRLIIMDMEKDTDVLVGFSQRARRLGIFTIGGGVPRNNTQNVAPLIEITKGRGAGDKLRMKRFTYGCRLCPDAMYYGHLSGCTYSEGESWRKFWKKGRRSQIRVDATMIWPFYVRHMLDRAESGKWVPKKKSA